MTSKLLFTTDSRGYKVCNTHRRYNGFGDKPRSGCPSCWFLWLSKLRFGHPTETDAIYIGRLFDAAKAASKKEKK